MRDEANPNLSLGLYPRDLLPSLTHILDLFFCFLDTSFHQLSHHAVHAVGAFLGDSNTHTRADLYFLVLTPRKGTNRILPSTFKTVNGLPKGLLYLRSGFPQTFGMGIRPLRIL